MLPCILLIFFSVSTHIDSKFVCCSFNFSLKLFIIISVFVNISNLSFLCVGLNDAKLVLTLWDKNTLSKNIFLLIPNISCINLFVSVLFLAEISTSFLYNTTIDLLPFLLSLTIVYSIPFISNFRLTQNPLLIILLATSFSPLLVSSNNAKTIASNILDF